MDAALRFGLETLRVRNLEKALSIGQVSVPEDVAPVSFTLFVRCCELL